MARHAPTINCAPEERLELERLAGSRIEPKQMIERAQIILGCLDGKRVKEVARACRTRPNTVIKWRQRFTQGGLAGPASECPLPLHSHLGQLVESGGDLVWHFVSESLARLEGQEHG